MNSEEYIQETLDEVAGMDEAPELKEPSEKKAKRARKRPAISDNRLDRAVVRAKENIYSHVTISLKQLDIAIVVICVVIVALIIAGILEARG